MKIRPIILCGGSGTRLWPLSRGLYPKQFLPLCDPDWSMLQQTLRRVQALPDVVSPIVVCHEEHRFIAAEQLQQIDTQDAILLLEPEAKNTAPAITLAALMSGGEGAQEVLLVLPADHRVKDFVAFAQSIANGVEAARDGAIVTFGVTPTHAETGYGYIEVDDPEQTVSLIQKFHEKPNAQIAEQYVSDQRFFWNAGIFLLSFDTLQQELKQHQPGLLASCKKAAATRQKDLDFVRVDADAYADIEAISFDYAVMEHTRRGRLTPLLSDWSDVGSWAALWEASEKDAQGNAVRGDVVLQATRDSHVIAETKVVAALGLTNVIVVETDDAVLVADKAQSAALKQVVETLATQDRSHVKHHRKVFRPWGWYDSIDVGPRFQVKRIHVKPGAQLSVQMHHHRAEHWVVVLGVAQVRNADQQFTLNANESTYIPIGAVHSLANPSETDELEIIEVQTGSYLGEDDIVRFEDQYGRE